MTLWKGTDWGTAAKPMVLGPAQNAQTPLEAQLDHFLDVIDGAVPLIDVANATLTLGVAQVLEADLAGQALNVAAIG